MRARLARLIALTGAAALVTTGALGAVPANAEPEPTPNLVVNIVDTTGQATLGNVTLLPVDDPFLENAITLGTTGNGDFELASTYEANVPPGDYGVLAITGWGGAICLGVSPCSLISMVGGPTGGGTPKVTAGITVPETGAKALTITSGLPVLRGDGSVGSPLTVDFPEGFDALQKLFRLYLTSTSSGLFSGIDLASDVEWTSGDTPIDDATGLRYRPTAADVGKAVSATVNYNPILAAFLDSMSGGSDSVFPIPDAFTTNAITAKKVNTSVTLQLPKKVKKGKRAKARVSATAGGNFITGWVKVKVARGGSDLVMVRRGYAELKLPKLKPGKHKVTATFLATNVYNSSDATKKIKVKAKKHKKSQHKKHDSKR